MSDDWLEVMAIAHRHNLATTAGLGEICFGRSGAGVIHETPAAHQRRESDVESSTGLFAKRNALLQERKDFR